MKAFTRTCAVTRERLPKSSLLRLAFDPAANAVVIDKKQTLHGRGVYIKPDRGTLEAAIKRGIIARQLHKGAEIVLKSKAQLLTDLRALQALSSNG